jgi:antibiotic biosynthesis monooxygenase (ABM) superfamily enzyme
VSASTAGARPLSATVVIAQSVRPKKEDEYLRWQAEITAACRTFPGFEAAEIVPPFPGVQDDCVVVFRFDSPAHLDAWLRSDARHALLARGESLFGGVARQQRSTRRLSYSLASWLSATTVMSMKPGSLASAPTRSPHDQVRPLVFRAKIRIGEVADA